MFDYSKATGDTLNNEEYIMIKTLKLIDIGIYQLEDFTFARNLKDAQTDYENLHSGYLAQVIISDKAAASV